MYVSYTILSTYSSVPNVTIRYRDQKVTVKKLTCMFYGHIICSYQYEIMHVISINLNQSNQSIYLQYYKHHNVIFCQARQIANANTRKPCFCSRNLVIADSGLGRVSSCTKKSFCCCSLLCLVSLNFVPTVKSKCILRSNLQFYKNPSFYGSILVNIVELVKIITYRRSITILEVIIVIASAINA